MIHVIAVPDPRPILPHDLLALKLCHIRQLISLSPQEVNPELLAQHGIRALHLAGTAGELPSPAQLRMLVRAMARMIERGQGVAVHCVSGNGRTGLLLAAYLMHQGIDVDAALAQVQASNPEFRLVASQRTLLLATLEEAGPDQGQRRVAEVEWRKAFADAPRATFHSMTSFSVRVRPVSPPIVQLNPSSSFRVTASLNPPSRYRCKVTPCPLAISGSSSSAKITSLRLSPTTAT